MAIRTLNADEAFAGLAAVDRGFAFTEETGFHSTDPLGLCPVENQVWPDKSGFREFG